VVKPLPQSQLGPPAVVKPLPAAPTATRPIAPPKAPEPDPVVEYAIDGIEIAPDVSFDDLSARFAQARKDKETLPTARKELTALYGVAVSTPYRGHTEVPDRIKVLEEWAAAKPDDPTPHVILAQLYMAWGWEARGSGFAYTVGEDGFRLFKERLGKALEHARAAEKLQPEDPELYTTLVDLGKGLGAERKHVDRWVETGRKIDPNYFPLYQATAAYLLPRWHGEVGDIEKFAEEMAEKIGGDDGLEAYFRIAMSMQLYDRSLLLYGDYDFAKISAGAQVQRKRYPTSMLGADFAAIVAWMDGRQADAKALRPYVKQKKPDLRYWGPKQVFDMYVRFCDQPTVEPPADRHFWPFRIPLYDAAYLDGGRKLIALPSQGGESIRIWNMDNLRSPETVLPSLPNVMHSVQTDTAGKIFRLEAHTREDQVAILFRIDSLEDPEIVRSPEKTIETQLSPDGRTTVLREGNKIVLREAETGDVVCKLDLDVRFAASLQFTPDSQRMLVGMNGKQYLFRLEDGQLERTFEDELPTRLPFRVRTIHSFLDSQTAIVRSQIREGRTNNIIDLIGTWNMASDERKVLLRLDGEYAQHSCEILAITPHLMFISKRPYAQPGPNGAPHSRTFLVLRLHDLKVLRKLEVPDGFGGEWRISPDEKQLMNFSSSQPGVRFWNIEGAAPANPASTAKVPEHSSAESGK
jgi:hypothetical protein